MKLFSDRKAIIRNEPFPLVLRFFLPPMQDISSLMHSDGFIQMQAVWLRETRQDGLQCPVCAVKKSLQLIPCLENIIVHG